MNTERDITLTKCIQRLRVTFNINYLVPIGTLIIIDYSLNLKKLPKRTPHYRLLSSLSQKLKQGYYVLYKKLNC